MFPLLGLLPVNLFTLAGAVTTKDHRVGMQLSLRKWRPTRVRDCCKTSKTIASPGPASGQEKGPVL